MPSARLHSRARAVAHYATVSKPKVLLLDDIVLAKKDLDVLCSKAQVLHNTAADRHHFVRKLQPGQEYGDIVALYRHAGTANSVAVTGPFDADLVRNLPPTVRYLAHNGAGYDQLDVPALTQRNIQVANVPSVVDEATADTALFLLIGTLRQFPVAIQHCEQSFNKDFPWRKASDPNGKVLGIVGAGGIGRALAYKASWALRMRVIYHNRNRLSEEVEQSSARGGMEYVSTLHELLRRSDAVSLHCPLTPETRGVIGHDELKQMRRTAVLINTARGPVVKEQELAQALEQGLIAGAGLDVFEAEPKVDSRLLAHRDKALLLPHVGTLTQDTQRETEVMCLRNLISGLDTGRLAFCVPEQRNVEWA